jgi:uncharacterized cofD-like protein
MKRRRVVMIGAGEDAARLLRALSEQPGLEACALVGATADGSGAPGLARAREIGRILGACARASPLLARVMTHRIEGDELDGVWPGSLVVSAAERLKGSIREAIDALREELAVAPAVLPAADLTTQLCAQLADERMIRGENRILGRVPRAPIRRVFHWPVVNALPECVRALAHADAIVLGPGPLLTGVVSTLLTRGLQTAARVSPALKVQVVDVLTRPGETDGMSARDHIETLSQYLGVAPDAAVVQARPVPRSWLRPHLRAGAEPLRLDVDGLRETRVIRADLIEQGGGAVSVRLAPEKLAQLIRSLV